MKIMLIPETGQEKEDYPNGETHENVSLFVLGMCTQPVPIPSEPILNRTIFHGPHLAMLHGIAELQMNLYKEWMAHDTP